VKGRDLEERIARTRAEMSGTLNEIERRLSPTHLIDEAKTAVRDATIGKAKNMVYEAGEKAKGAGATIVETIRENPIPMALVGAGILWMVFNPTPSRRARTMRRRSMHDEGIGIVDRGQEAVGSAIDRGQEAVGSAIDRAQEVSGDAARKVRDATQAAGERIGEVVRDTSQKVGTMARDVYEGAENRIETLMRDNPLALGAAAFAIGTAIGLAIPSTRREDQLLGSARDQLVGKAERIARETMDKAEEKVNQALGPQQEQGQESETSPGAGI